jgi:hypothetical protein
MSDKRIFVAPDGSQITVTLLTGWGGTIRPAPADIAALVESLRAMWGWAIELPSMAEFASWDDATKADFFLAMRKAEDLLKIIQGKLDQHQGCV